MKVIDIEKIITKDKNTNEPNGIFLPIWRSWDSKYNIKPDMVYVSTIPRGSYKGPHLHKKRTGYISVLTGRAALVFKTGNKYEEIIVSAEEPKTIEVPPNTGFLSINIGEDTCMILNICSPAWHPEDPDNYTDDFTDYEINKWSKYIAEGIQK